MAVTNTVGGGVPDAPRRGQDPSLRCHDNERFVGSGLDRSVPVRGGGNLPLPRHYKLCNCYDIADFVENILCLW